MLMFKCDSPSWQAREVGVQGARENLDMRELDGCLLFPSYSLRFCPHLNGNRSSHPIESQDWVYLTLAEMGLCCPHSILWCAAVTALNFAYLSFSKREKEETM